MSADCFDDGRVVKIVNNISHHNDYFEFIYNGFMMSPDSPGYGIVISHDYENIHYWKRPECEGGAVIIDDEFSNEKLESYGIFICNLALRGSR